MLEACGCGWAQRMQAALNLLPLGFRCFCGQPRSSLFFPIPCAPLEFPPWRRHPLSSPSAWPPCGRAGRWSAPRAAGWWWCAAPGWNVLHAATVLGAGTVRLLHLQRCYMHVCLWVSHDLATYVQADGEKRSPLGCEQLRPPGRSEGPTYPTVRDFPCQASLQALHRGGGIIKDWKHGRGCVSANDSS